MKTAPANSVDRMFRALADPTRLRILNLLLRGELCVCEIVGVLGVSQPTASRHLAYLRRAGLVLARKEGLWHYYKLTPPASPFHRRLIDCLSCCLDAVPQLQRDSKRLTRKSCC
jgi:ArsR family transcriptional regulator, arsenate/arsenite/antimonite-responsive transcriptional repressor